MTLTMIIKTHQSATILNPFYIILLTQIEEVSTIRQGHIYTRIGIISRQRYWLCDNHSLCLVAVKQPAGGVLWTMQVFRSIARGHVPLPVPYIQTLL